MYFTGNDGSSPEYLRPPARYQVPAKLRDPDRRR